jgi:hypothetical protein
VGESYVAARSWNEGAAAWSSADVREEDIVVQWPWVGLRRADSVEAAHE